MLNISQFAKACDTTVKTIRYYDNIGLLKADYTSEESGIRHISVFEHENEILCSKESRYIVERTEIDEDYITHVYVREDDKL